MPKDEDLLAALTSAGQSLWLDNIRRSELESGRTEELIRRGDIRGMTSNPSIFAKAIAAGHDYDEAIRALAWSGWDAEKIFWQLAIEDVRAALDLFSPLYEQSNGADGYVSIEVNPNLAHETDATLAQAQQLWARVARPNLMVKIPATKEGIPAIRRAVAAGLNINITLIFSRSRYAAVMDAYMAGLEDRLGAGKAIDHVASVASFFVSRVDTKVDKQLPKSSPLRGKAAIANAKLAYQDFRETFRGPRWEALRAGGARLQRPLWASTSTKDPVYPDTLYVDELVGPDTVNTLPPHTLDAARDHARHALSIVGRITEARDNLEALEGMGISMDSVTGELETEGVTAFADAFETVLANIDERREAETRRIGALGPALARQVETLVSESLLTRFCAKDPTLWSDDPDQQEEISHRMGWMEAPDKAMALVQNHRDFAEELRAEGTTRFLVIGMGGSSLTAEALSTLFRTPDASKPNEVCLAILDSTDPGQVAQAASDFPPQSSLYIVSSKSGGTAEVSAAFEYFWRAARSNGSRFVAITDAGTSLAQLAQKLGFRRVFLADPDVGGRYSALTEFGLVPGALLDIDLDRLISRAVWMQRQCARELPAARSPGILLGALLGAAALAGRDKLTIVADPPLEALPHWIEQLVAESTGKSGKGILPVPLEPLDAPSVYGPDRLFYYLRRAGDLDVGVEALLSAGFPVIIQNMPEATDVGAEFIRWEVAVPVACHILGVNAFDQPDVEESKERTKAKVAEFREKGTLQEGEWDLKVDGSRAALGQANRLWSFLEQIAPGDFVAINAYLQRDQASADELQRMRVLLRERTRAAVVSGFGPRFQHSTGQLHKGGPNKGLFIQIVSDATEDIDIPGQDMSFGTFIRAQALGDYETLLARGRRVLRVHLERPSDLALLRKGLQWPV